MEAFATPKKPEGIDEKSAWHIVVSRPALQALRRPASLIRDAQMPGEHITLVSSVFPSAGGPRDGICDATKGFAMRGGRGRWINHFECMWICSFKSIPSTHKSRRDRVFSEYYHLHKDDPKLLLCRVTEKQGRGCAHRTESAVASLWLPPPSF
ncbi:MAG: oleate hydratase [Subdoligranulum sp.]